MKITNEEIAKPTYWMRHDQWGIRVCSDFGDLAFFKNDRDAAERVLSLLDRLAELEAKEHERRWRKIADEGLPRTGEEAMNAEWSDGEIILNSDDWKATHWRPQDTTLPEAT